jgi:hypothetical protein
MKSVLVAFLVAFGVMACKSSKQEDTAADMEKDSIGVVTQPYTDASVEETDRLTAPVLLLDRFEFTDEYGMKHFFDLNFADKYIFYHNSEHPWHRRLALLKELNILYVVESPFEEGKDITLEFIENEFDGGVEALNLIQDAAPTGIRLDRSEGPFDNYTMLRGLDPKTKQIVQMKWSGADPQKERFFLWSTTAKKWEELTVKRTGILTTQLRDKEGRVYDLEVEEGHMSYAVRTSDKSTFQLLISNIFEE